MFRPGLSVLLLTLVVGWARPGRAQRATLDYVSEGLTRDTLEQAARPQPAPTETPTTIRSRRAPLPAKGKTVSHRQARHGLAAQHRVTATTVVSKPNRPRRRPPVVRFVYWWNGWVLRTFHTKFGTVLLHTIGAEQTKT